MKTMKSRANGPRILTIDNGGLQAISVLLVLKDVCQALSKANGLPESSAPHEIFDIIAGVGTGGWLAILLGRYKLNIEQCMGIYISIANAIDPIRKTGSVRERGLPVAIDQAILIDKVDKVIREYNIGETLLDAKDESDSNADSHVCRAFAVGVVKRGKADQEQKYHLFRAYKSFLAGKQDGPDPTRCKVSAACAATTAAKDFCKEFSIGGTTYWDENFPNTHNVSGLALDEAAAIFDKATPDFVLSISPGIPTDEDIGKLHKIAHKNASATFRFRQSLKSLPGIRRVMTADNMAHPSDNAPALGPRSQSSPALLTPKQNVNRSNTSSSTSSAEREREHQRSIRTRLTNDFDDENIYHRLELPPQDETNTKPYLSDISSSDEATNLAMKFLKLAETQAIIHNLIARSQRVPESEEIVQDRPRSYSPEPFGSGMQRLTPTKRSQETQRVPERTLAMAL